MVIEYQKIIGTQGPLIELRTAKGDLAESYTFPQIPGRKHDPWTEEGARQTAVNGQRLTRFFGYRYRERMIWKAKSETDFARMREITQWPHAVYVQPYQDVGYKFQATIHELEDREVGEYGFLVESQQRFPHKLYAKSAIVSQRPVISADGSNATHFTIGG